LIKIKDKTKPRISRIKKEKMIREMM